MIRFLIDECLSPRLVQVAEAHGYEGAHVVAVGLAEQRDELVAERAIATGAVVVTNNARDYRRLYARLHEHPGLIIVLPSVSRPSQVALFEQVIGTLDAQPETKSRMITVRRDGAITIEPWPRRG